MKKLTIVSAFLAGALVGICGEYLIPNKYSYGQTSGCLAVDNKRAFMPAGALYDPKLDEYPRDFYLNRGFIPSYKFLFAQFTGEAKWLPQEECNKLRELYLEGQEKDLE